MSGSVQARRIRRVVRVGFMAAGKTTVGRRLADLLGWRFETSSRISKRPPDGASLRVSAEEAVRRAGADSVVRPLLRTADPLASARHLLTVREPDYAQADWIVDVNGRAPLEVARALSERLKQAGVDPLPRQQDGRGGV
ncbi:MAG: hypothetical protein P8099_03370 [Gemmatimonadota bacterium]